MSEVDPFLPPVPRQLVGVDPEIEGYFRQLGEIIADLTAETNRPDRWRVYDKQADETRNNTNTPADDAELIVPVLANRTYMMRFEIFYETQATPDFYYGFDGPGSPTNVVIRARYAAPSSAIPTSYTDTAFGSLYAPVDGAGGLGGYVQGTMLLQNGANAGNVAFQWSQNTPDAGDTTVLAGSMIEVMALP